jgi:hypothetical protein
MNRVHGFEFNDQEWLPQFMTSWMTSVLHVCHRTTGDGYVWASKVMGLLDRSGEDRILDLCSGGGGPVLDLVRVLEGEHNRQIHLTLSDLIPNQRTAEAINGQGPNRVYITHSVNATDVPADWPGVRTVFSGLHHMKPEIAFGFLKNAFDRRKYIFIGETTKRTLPTVVKYAKAAKHFFAATNDINPTRAQSFLTFRLPILPAMLGWDNVMSCLRTYSAEELRGFTDRLSAPDYEWEIGELYNPVMETPYPYIMGYPIGARRSGALPRSPRPGF